MVAVAGDGVKQFFIGVLTQVSKRWEVVIFMSLVRRNNSYFSIVVI